MLDCHDIDAIATAIKKLKDNKDLRKAMATEAKNSFWVVNR